MADEVIKQNEIEVKETEKEPSLENLKNFLGDNFKDGMSLADIDSFLKGKKFADLTKGEYVSRGKYNELEEKNKKYADYDTIKKENAEYKAKEKQSTLIGIAKSVNVADEFIEFVLSKVNTDCEDVEKEIKNYVEANPQYIKSYFTQKTNPSFEVYKKVQNEESMRDAVSNYYKKK